MKRLTLYYVMEKDCWGDSDHDKLIKIYDNLPEAQKHSEASKDYYVEVRVFEIHVVYTS